MNNVERSLSDLILQVLAAPGEKKLPLSCLTALPSVQQKYAEHSMDIRNYPVVIDGILVKVATQKITARELFRRRHLIAVDTPNVKIIEEWLKHDRSGVVDVSLIQSVIAQPKDMVFQRGELAIRSVVIGGQILPAIAQAIKRVEENPAQILMFGHTLGYMTDESRGGLLRTLAQNLSPRHALLLSVDTNFAEHHSLNGLYDSVTMREWVLDLWRWFFRYCEVMKSDLEGLPVRYECSYNIVAREMKVSVVFTRDVNFQKDQLPEMSNLSIAKGTEVVMFRRHQFDYRTLVNELILTGWQVKSSFSAQHIHWLVCER